MIGVIISGGQTGADRAALDWVIERNVPHDGWCPKGRKALDAPLDFKYQLRETPSGDYLQRNEWNVRDTDATVVFTFAATITGGSKKTIEFAQALSKPLLHIHPGLDAPAQALADFVNRHSVSRLNVAGSRESKEPGLYMWVRTVLSEAFPPDEP
jgi:hypothetical protein